MTKELKNDDTWIPAWDRGFISIREIQSYVDQPDAPKTIEKQRADYDSNYIKILSPIAVSGNLQGVIEIDGAIFHPPLIWRKRCDTGEWAQVLFENGYIHSTEHANFSGTGPSGKFSDDCGLLYGLRVDTPPNCDLWRSVDKFLSVVREFTHQWWISSARDPFNLGLRFMARLDQNKNVIEGFPDRSYAMSHPWIPAAGLQKRLGLESPLDQYRWDQCKEYIERGTPRESATQSTLNAFSQYFLHEDGLLIISAAIALEIMERKMRFLAGRPTKEYGEKLIKNSVIWDENDKGKFNLLFTDRNNLAHGRPAFYLQKDEKQARVYVQLLEKHYRKYLDLAKQFDWHDVATK